MSLNAAYGTDNIINNEICSRYTASCSHGAPTGISMSVTATLKKLICIHKKSLGRGKKGKKTKTTDVAPRSHPEYQLLNCTPSPSTLFNRAPFSKDRLVLGRTPRKIWHHLANR